MKKILIALPVLALLAGSCGGSDAENNLENLLQNKEDFDKATVTFEDGGAESGEQYFFGVQAEVIEVDVKFREVELLDEEDAPASEINAALDSVKMIIKDAKRSMKLYNGKNWPLQDELNDITTQWFDGIQMLVDDYLRPLAPVFSKPDSDWSDDEVDLYTEYLDAYDEYLEIDEEWVNFQYEYAEANGFTFGTETIDVDALVEEDLNK